tara:strand:- start:489 stop:647 length:159 start_codon:yes stop_codon:yes gene_type:complete
MPTYQQSNKIKWVARYTYLSSSEDNGVRLGRYNRKVVEMVGVVINTKKFMPV